MHRTGVAANENPRPPYHGDQLSKGASKRRSCSVAGADNFGGKFFFAGAVIHQRLQPTRSQSLRDFGVALRRPALRSPAGSRANDGKFSSAT